jgi:uncharacterized protein
MELSVEVVYVLADRACAMTAAVEPGATLRQAIERSGLLERFPEIDLARHKVGVFGKLRGVDERISAGDRVEIYRPLLADPKERRRRLERGRA